MSSLKKAVKQEYQRLKKVVEKILKPAPQKSFPQPALQPVRERRKY